MICRRFVGFKYLFLILVFFASLGCKDTSFDFEFAREQQFRNNDSIASKFLVTLNDSSITEKFELPVWENDRFMVEYFGEISKCVLWKSDDSLSNLRYLTVIHEISKIEIKTKSIEEINKIYKNYSEIAHIESKIKNLIVNIDSSMYKPISDIWIEMEIGRCKKLKVSARYNNIIYSLSRYIDFLERLEYNRNRNSLILVEKNKCSTFKHIPCEDLVFPKVIEYEFESQRKKINKYGLFPLAHFTIQY